MTPIPMFTPPPHPDGWHRVTAPGGYESWHFEAVDAEGRWIVVDFHDGCPSDATYLRRYANYRRRPTRTRPPVPADFPCVFYDFFASTSGPSRRETTYPAGSLSASPDGAEIVVGPNRLRREADGTVRLSLDGPDPQRKFAAEVAFRPIAPPGPELSIFPSRAVPDAEHRWVVAGPACDVEATIEGDDGRTTFVGRGYHDHAYGTAPLGLAASSHVLGRTLGEGDTSHVFRLVVPRGAATPVTAHLFRADAAGCHRVDVVAPQVRWPRFGQAGTYGLRHPTLIDLGPNLRLSNPRILSSGGDAVRFTYDADVDGRRGRAVCEVVHLPRPL